MADQIPPWGRAHRRIEREAARELAKSLMREGVVRTGKFRWDLTLACVVAVIGLLVIIAPPQSRSTMLAWIIVMFGFAVYPALHFAQWLPTKNKGIARAIGIAGLVAIMCGLGYFEWPAVRRHILEKAERKDFEGALKVQTGSDFEVQIACPSGEEKVCVHAEQFINLFGESGWNVQPSVARVTFSRAAAGVTVYRHGGNKKYLQTHWNGGAYFPINEPHILAIQKAFRIIHIEIEGGSNPDLPENVTMVYFGVEKDNEAEPNEFTRETDWATGKVKGPFPNRE